MTSSTTSILLMAHSQLEQAMLTYQLSGQSFRLHLCPQENQLWPTLFEHQPDILLLVSDTNHSGQESALLIERIRQHCPLTPIILLQTADLSQQRIAALNAGVDAILTAPYALDELLALIRRQIERARLTGTALCTPHQPRRPAPAPDLQAQPHWQLSGLDWSLSAPDGTLLSLTPLEYQFLRLLCDKSEPTSRQQISDLLGRGDWDNYERAVSTLVSRLRKRWSDLSGTELPLRALRGHGYLFTEPLQLIEHG